MLKKHSAFIQISPTVIIAKQHIKSVLGDKILLSNEIAYTVLDAYKDQFARFVKSNFTGENTPPDTL